MSARVTDLPKASVWTLAETSSAVRYAPRDALVTAFPDLDELLERLAATRSPELLMLELAALGEKGLARLDAALAALEVPPSVLLLVDAHDLLGELHPPPSDFVVTPVHPAELCARMDALLTRHRRHTRRERTLLELEEQQRMLDEAQRIAAFGSWEWNVHSGALVWSHGLYRIYGIDPAIVQITYETFLARLHPEDREKIQGLIGEALTTQEPFAYTERILRPDGSVRFLRSRGEVLVDEQGRTRGLAGVCHDVTEQMEADARAREAEDAARRMADQVRLGERMATVGTMAAGVAHEINNPLAFVGSNVELALEETRALISALMDEDEDACARLERMREMLDDAGKGVRRVRGIIKDLAAFSRASDERIAAVSLHAVLDATLDMLRHQVRHHARVSKRFFGVPSVDGDEGKLAQVFSNLLVNAAQAIPEGDAMNNEIDVHTFTDEAGHAVVEIRDTGMGIPESLRARIFDPFFTTKPHGAGTGIGLAICHGIVTGYSGTLSVTSEVGHGSTFRVTLPPGRRARTEMPPARRGTEPPIARGRVLVVDDEQLVLDAVRRILSREHEVVLERSGRAAIERILGGERFDVIVCDVMMPDVTGPDMHHALAKRAPDQAERMLFLTGGAFTPHARHFLDSVQNPRVGKPFDVKELRDAVSQHLRDTRATERPPYLPQED